jgi:hypothetical protein
MIDFTSIEYFFTKQDRFRIEVDLTTKKPSNPLVKIKSSTATPARKKVDPPLPKKDQFYSDWEEKYKKLQAFSLLAQKPFNKHALFVIEKGDPEEFANQICGAINSRIMKTTFVVLTTLLDDLIAEHNPSHLILKSTIYNNSNLPSIEFDDLKEMKNDNEKKKLFWNLLKEKLKN